MTQGQIMSKNSNEKADKPAGGDAAGNAGNKQGVIYLSSDHAGIDLRRSAAEHLLASGYQIQDLGPHGADKVDYPDFGAKLAQAMKDDSAARGIAICGSGIGISIAVNRFPWVRAALVTDAIAARLSREHNDANVLALGQRLTTIAVALDCVDAFMATEFAGGRHAGRVEKLGLL
jgi:ribose 5-phosphate isomerase B